MEEFELKWNRKVKLELPQGLRASLIKSTEKWKNFYIYRLVFQKNLVYEFLGETGGEIKYWKLNEGIFYWHDRLLGYFHLGLHLQAKREKVLNVFAQEGRVFLIQGNVVSRFQYKSKYRNAKGVFRLPIATEVVIRNLSGVFSEEELGKSFLFGKVSGLQVIISLNKVGIIRSELVVQTLRASSAIISMKERCLETINREYCIERKVKDSEVQFAEFYPEKRTLLALARFYCIDEVVDLLFFKAVSVNVEKMLTNDWHLDPLDRSFLASDKFYQEKLYDYLGKYLDLTVQGLFLTNPDKLLMLQEALREQEGRIYKDSHLQPNKTIASLITSSLPLPSSYDTVLQANIRSLFLKNLKKM